MFTFSIKDVPLEQLIQDKICMKHLSDEDYCKKVPEMTLEDDVKGIKTTVLKESTKFNLYIIIIITCPSIIWSLFFGPWMDKFVHARKILLIIIGLGAFGESLMIAVNAFMFHWDKEWLLLAISFNGITGGIIVCSTVMRSYIAITTPPKWIAIRMVIFKMCFFLMSQIATLLGGKLLTFTPLFGNGQLNNHVTIFMISSFVSLFSIFWAVFTINQEKEKVNFYKKFGPKNQELEVKDQELYDKNANLEKSNEKTNPIKLLFDFNNVVEMFKTCVKKRKSNVRAQIWLLLIALVIYLISALGVFVFMYQFTQRVYLWNAETFSYALSIKNFTHTFTLLTIVPFLVKVLKIKDTSLTLIGLCGMFFEFIIRATILNPVGFFISIFPGSFGTVTSVGIRTYCSKIIPNEETGKIFSLMAIIDSLAPLISSSIFALIFTATVHKYPSLCFFIEASMLLIPIFIIMKIDFYSVVFENEKENEKSKEIITTTKL